MSTRTFTADRGDHQRRLDHVVRRHLADLAAASRTRVQAWVGRGWVSVDGRPATRAAQRVLAGQEVGVVFDDARAVEGGPAPEDIPLTILYEDETLLVLDKPAGLVVHPSYGHRSGTLVNALAHLARRWPEGRPSLVHRLDKYTSGVMVVAKSRQAHAALARALAHPEARKDYLALCYGRMRSARRRLRLPLGRDPLDRRRVVVRDDGVEAVTEVTRVREGRGPNRGLTLVRCRLLTGRMHQIRVHLAADGLPIVGDAVYGKPGWQDIRDEALAAALRAFPRQALHAWRLTFVHPANGAWFGVEAPLPSGLAELLVLAGLDRGSVAWPL